MKRLIQNTMKGPWIFLAPLAFFMSAFIFLPVLGTFIDSFLRDVTFLSNRFTGLDNYLWMAKDRGFRQALWYTLLFVGVSVPLEMICGLLFALLLNEPFPLRGILRACVLIPWAVPSAISARVWELIYNYSYGLANFVLLKCGIIHEPVNWLGSAAGAFFSIVLADAWKTIPFVVIILLAGLAAIPKDLYQQAQVDGARMFQRFTRITLPLLRPALVVALIFRTIDALRIFDLNYVLTHGGPGGATTSLSLHAYRYFLMGDFGYGSSVSVVLFLLALTLSMVYVRAGRFAEELQ